MKFALYLFISSAVATPLASIESSTLYAMADVAQDKGPNISNLPDKSVRCGGMFCPTDDHPTDDTDRDRRAMEYDPSEVQRAAEIGLKHVFDGKSVGPNKYPHHFTTSHSQLKFHEPACRKNEELYVFPITRGEYTGGPTTDITDRVVFKANERDGVYCGLITHTGAAGNDFVNCSG
jgi:hypothetical protein